MTAELLSLVNFFPPAKENSTRKPKEPQLKLAKLKFRLKGEVKLFNKLLPMSAVKPIFMEMEMTAEVDSSDRRKSCAGNRESSAF